MEHDDEQECRIVELARSRAKIRDKVEAIVDLAQAQFSQRLQQNHGIRERNLRCLLHPAGVDIADLDATWIAELDNFANVRGEVAHSAKSTIRSVNPFDEYNRVERLLIGLQDLDQKIMSVV